ncbi:MAG: response regulator [Planctomycetota bacterium]|nr:MAG: response regulator [Planctomycetota bacterium]REJ91017.1 MAG: response regulator [Planctomycetota bacterium]REK31023.1 MAG: response regulator [Planctomycetota bacterium]REK36860.1 MAG: response regulator [Planctomycetota bacterium]
MSDVLRMAIVDPNDSSRSITKNLLLGIDSIWLEAECSRYEFFSDVLTQTNPDIAVVAIDSDPQRGLALVAQITNEFPECNPLVVSGSQEGSVILQAMRNGAKEFLAYPLQIDDFVSALDRIRNTVLGSSSGGKARGSRVIAIAGASGGVGCTSLAINLACVLAQNQKNTVTAIDLDTALGDADVWLDIIPDYTIQDVAENITRLDYSLLKRSLTQHDSGAFLLPRPVHLDDRPAITPDEFQRVVALLKATFTHLIVDVSKSFNPLDMAAIESADMTLLVTQLDLPCLRNVVRLMQFLDERDLGEKIRVVVNRIGLEDSQISLNKALETIGREVYWKIPNDYASMVESRNNGVPLMTQAPRAKVTKSIEQLAAQIDNAPVLMESAKEEEKPRKGKSLFSFLGSGSR